MYGVIEHKWPHHVAVAADDGVCAAKLVRLVWIQCGVDAAKHHRGAARPRSRPDLVPAQGISRVYPYSDHVAGANRVEIERLEGFVGKAWWPIHGWCGGSKHEEPAWRDYTDAE
jgi:hypothetical protein